MRRVVVPLLAILSLLPPNQMPQQIQQELSSFRGTIGVAALNLISGEEFTFNGDVRFPTASAIKTAVMVEAYAQIAAKSLSLDTRFSLKKEHKVGGAGILGAMHDGMELSTADLIHLMIVLSDNTATNMLIERVGTANVNARLEHFGIKDMKLFRPTFRDGRADVLPDLEREFGLGMTTPRAMARLMALIAEGQAVNAEASEAMLATLRKQQDRAMIPRLLPQDGLQIGNKTGTDEEKHAGPDGRKRHVRADAAIVTGPGIRYVIAIHARQVEDGRWGIENEAVVTGARLARAIHDRFTRPR